MTKGKSRLDYSYYNVPEHTREALENYFFYGYLPGSFVTAVITNDLVRACNSCDHINREAIVDITKWVMHNAPNGSWGNHNNLQNWLHDADSCRTKFVEEWEKRAMWESLQE